MIVTEIYPVLLGGTFLLAVLDWIIVGRGWGRLRYLTKPAVLVALTLWFWLATGWKGSSLWFGLGLVFSLFGDIALMIPRNWFLVGLVNFLIAHICYIASFNPRPPPLPPTALTVVILLIAWALVYYRVIRVALAKIPGNRRLRVGVGFYSLVITIMLISALLTLFRPEIMRTYATLIATGAVLFFTSDSLLAYDRFYKKVPNGRVLVRITYHLGQMAMACGMALHIASGGL